MKVRTGIREGQRIAYGAEPAPSAPKWPGFVGVLALVAIVAWCWVSLVMWGRR